MKKLSNLIPGSLSLPAKVIVIFLLPFYALFFIDEPGAMVYFLIAAITLLTGILLIYHWPQRLDFFSPAIALVQGKEGGRMVSFKALPIQTSSFASIPLQRSASEESLASFRSKIEDICAANSALSVALVDKEFQEEKPTALQRILLFGLLGAYLRYVTLSQGIGKVVIELVSFDHAVQVIITDCRRGIRITDASDTDGIREMTSRIALHKGSFDMYNTKVGSRVLMAQL